MYALYSRVGDAPFNSAFAKMLWKLNHLVGTDGGNAGFFCMPTPL